MLNKMIEIRIRAKKYHSRISNYFNVYTICTVIEIFGKILNFMGDTSSIGLFCQ